MADDTLPKRHSGLRIFGIVVVCLILLTGASCLMVSCLGNSRMREIEKETPKLIDETLAREPKRPVLYGTATAGRAWEEYEAALALVKAFSKERAAERNVVAKYADEQPASDREAAAKLVAEFMPALERLTAGAVRENGMMSFDWKRGVAMELPGLLGAQTIANFAVARARLLALEGRYRESLDCLSDVLTFSRDLSYNGVLITHMIGTAQYGVALTALRDIVGAPDFPAAELPEVARRLELVERSFPGTEWTYRNDHIMMRVSLQEVWHGKSSEDFSVIAGLMGATFFIANAITAMEDYCRRLGAMSEKSWAEVVAAGPVLEKEAMDSWNPIVKIALPGLVAAGRSVRERLAHLRLLRCYVGWRMTGKVPEVADPFDGVIRSDVAGPKVKFWSRGRNGVDDGGKGVWRQTGEDIVLELP